MVDIVIPVKSPCKAKKRLAGILAPPQRGQLVLAMLADVLRVIEQVPAATAWVVSGDVSVASVAHRHNANVIKETHELGYNCAVRSGIALIAGQHTTGCNVAVVPGDLPCLTISDIEMLCFATDLNAGRVRLAPSTDQRGTNGLFMSHNSLLPPAFGVDSFPGYKNTCVERKLNCEVLHSPTIATDIDTPADLLHLLNRDVGGETGRCLRASSFLIDQSLLAAESNA